MSVIFVTGAAGLVGAEVVRSYCRDGYSVVGIDNDLRAYFFGREASTAWATHRLQEAFPNYEHHALDIRDLESLETLFETYGRDIEAVLHTAAQPSHDWAAREPLTDFAVNAQATLQLLELTRRHAPEAAFVFTSTSKVYGDRPNRLPLVELESRWECHESHSFAAWGIDETMSIDQSLHSVFGASKVAADVMVQEYGRYFGLSTGIFRGGCLTGSGHSGAELHGFLAYLMKCALTRTPYRIFGYKGKQVRDNIHAADLVRCFRAFVEAPRVAEVYNIGGGRACNCSILEAIEHCERITGHRMDLEYLEEPRIGDHIWWIGDLRKFQSHYPEWSAEYDLVSILEELHEGLRQRA